jgi:hypothetical protein
VTPFCDEISRIRRAFGLYRHDFESWNTVAEGDIKHGLPPAAVMVTNNPHWYTVGRVRLQQRICKRCGLVEERTDETRFGE